MGTAVAERKREAGRGRQREPEGGREKGGGRREGETDRQTRRQSRVSHRVCSKTFACRHVALQNNDIRFGRKKERKGMLR